MTPIFHITHLSNLPAIIRERGLWSDLETERRGLCQQGIAYPEIKERRKRRAVVSLAGKTVGAGGVVADYVPFYFANRSPMLYAVFSGSVAGYLGGERNVVYLVSSAERVTATSARWCFSNGHAAEGITDFFDTLTDLPRVDRQIIQSWSWKDTLADPDRKRKKQAEFLVHERFLWEWVERIAVMDLELAQQVKELLAGAADAGHCPPVTTEPKWYYTTTVNRR